MWSARCMCGHSAPIWERTPNCPHRINLDVQTVCIIVWSVGVCRDTPHQFGSGLRAVCTAPIWMYGMSAHIVQSVWCMCGHAAQFFEVAEATPWSLDNVRTVIVWSVQCMCGHFAPIFLRQQKQRLGVYPDAE
ncbi:Hypothetical predicted protein [Olea europaea subsp. europaea]|uniref:Uncharacterized protein n=1 Tax=Olea europaea subsp. europaea TaxID=158383 RepID=A0A8S0R7X0_OLEEU|nr:Hypothetical predicted protein [Olea europaea subsp. europaea]